MFFLILSRTLGHLMNYTSPTRVTCVMLINCIDMMVSSSINRHGLHTHLKSMPIHTHLETITIHEQ